MWSDLYQLWSSGWLDHSRSRNPKNNPKEGNRKIFRFEFVFESYSEVNNDVWGECGCISKDYDIFVLDNISLRRWKAGVKNVFVCRIVRLFRIVWCRVERSDKQRYILWAGIVCKFFPAYVTGCPESDTLIGRLALKQFCVWNCTSM